MRASTRRPYANSISTDFAKLIPNTTDVVKFAPGGWTLLNWGIIGNETRYHSPGDTVAALDRASLYHVGSEVLAQARAFSDMPDPARSGAGRMVFTDIAGRAFIRLPLIVAAIALGLLLLAGALLAWRRERCGQAIAALRRHGRRRDRGGAASSASPRASSAPAIIGAPIRSFSYLAVYAVMLAAMAAIWARWGRRFSREQMRAAAWLFVLIFGAALSLALPGATIFFLIAPAIALAGIASLQPRPRRPRGLVAPVPDARAASRADRDAAHRRAAPGRRASGRARGLARDRRMRC